MTKSRRKSDANSSSLVDATGALTLPQQRAIEALLTNPTIQDAATAAGISRASIHNWLRRSPAFRNAYREARGEALSHAIAMTQRYAPLAVQTLAKITGDERAPFAVRVNAAAHLLNFGKKVGDAESEQVEAERQSIEYTRTTATAEGVEVERLVMLADKFGRLKDLPPALQAYAKELREQRKGQSP